MTESQKKLDEMRDHPAWMSIYDDNHEFVFSGIESFYIKHKKEVDIFTKLTKRDIYSQLRIDELLRSCADDLFRYATYHKVKNNQGLYEIAEAIHASYLVKWIMHFRPLVLDEYQNHSDHSIDDDMGDFFRLGNEKLAIYVASMCLNLVEKEDGSDSEILCCLSDFMEREELKDFMYTLRYRTCHQDSYRALFRRIVSSAPQTNINKCKNLTS